ncbi:flagellar biosynthesis protein FlgL [Acetobacter sp.]|uniref:flagellar biosynthesis protein FlgL n=1 Tax=Acetobacter sp. TaxID=440 RepID=UPI0039E73CE5
MTSSVGLYGASGTTYVLQQEIKRLDQEQTTLSYQASSGMKADSYAALDTGQRTQALSLVPQVTALATWQTSVQGAQTNLDITQTALTQISSIASTLSTNILSLKGNLGQDELQTIAESAQSALGELGTYLNTTGSSGYVFAGQDSGTIPVTDAAGLADSSLATATADAVSALDTDGAASVFAKATQDASDNSLSVFSSTLSTDPVSASSLTNKAVIGQGQVISVGMTATQGTTTGDGTTTTGSPIRDLMRNLMIVASLGSADTSSSNFTDLVSQLQSSTTTISSELSAQVGSLGLTQTSLTAQASSLSTMSVMLASQLSDVTELSSSDLAAVATQTTTVQNQIESSYALVAAFKSMTLANYL